MLSKAAEAGCTPDQMGNFLHAGYIMIDGYQQFHAWAREADHPGGPDQIALGGKRGPGKSHAEMAQAGLDDMQRVDGLKFLFIRKIQKSATEAMEDLVRRVFMYTEHTLTQDGVKLKNGSRMLIGGYKDDRDIEKYLGLEYDGICLGEATQISKSKYDALRGSLRTSKRNWRPRLYADANPDGIGLMWFKETFIEPARAGLKGSTRFLDVTNIHNPFTNIEYEDYLNSLTGNLRKAWKDGDWDAFAGMAFLEWSRARHVVKPFSIPDHWVKWKATDWGFASPMCTLWGAKNPDTGRLYVYRELYKAGLPDRQQAAMILDMSPQNEKYVIHYADPSLWERKTHRGETFSTADEYREGGIILVRADNDRIAGIRRLHQALANLPDGRPGLIIFNTSLQLIRQLSSLASAEPPGDPEDIADGQEDHAYDALRYLLTNQKHLDRKEPKRGEGTGNPLNRRFNSRAIRR